MILISIPSSAQKDFLTEEEVLTSGMHGRPRKPQKPEDEASSVAKAETLRALQAQFLSFHHSKTYTQEATKVSARLLEINPELYTAWNFRKLAVEQHLSQSQSDPDLIKSVLDDELRVVETALKQNFKAYGAWYHRKWVISKGHSSIGNELRLLERFQNADSRNFHAWSYRRFVAAMMNRSEEEELNYTADMINTNFSNYSAWHNRSIHLSSLCKQKARGFSNKEEVLNEEFELVHQALFTDPDDQSGWFHYLWLLDQTVKNDSPRLISSWPPHGGSVIISKDACLKDCDLSPFDNFVSEDLTFPLILYFDQAVEGINSSTVSVEYVTEKNKHLVWLPLSESNSKIAKVWVTHLSFPDQSICSSDLINVEVSLGQSQGICSSTECLYSHDTQFSFKVRVRPAIPKADKREVGEMICWKAENFFLYKMHPQESNPIMSLDQITIEEDELSSSKWAAETITSEIALFRELLSVSNCKIGKLTLARLLMAQERMSSSHSTKLVNSEEVLELYNDLIKMDPTHRGYYKAEHSVILLELVTSSWESLLRHCYCYRTPTLSTICLRLNGLSISRIGSVERFLWVQMLDLSHNELQSIEGLEALQLLCYLNLSNNKLSNFTALEPLRLLKSLKVLNISYNEIGLHSIDTTRYLFSSPLLSHTTRVNWNLGEFPMDDGDLASYWEAYFILKDLRLVQLDTVGNVISNDKFTSFLARVLPTLKWFNGVELK